MKIRQTCVSMVMASGILLFAGCSFPASHPQEGVQSDSALERHSKSLAGSYSDIGSDGAIKPHAASADKMTQERQSRTTGAIILGGPVPIPDLKTGKTTIKGSPEGTTPSPGSVKDSTGSFGEADGK